MGATEPDAVTGHDPHLHYRATLKGPRMKSTTSLIAILGLMLTACAPELGSERWCAKMKETPKGEWSLNDAKAYAQHCVFEDDPTE